MKKAGINKKIEKILRNEQVDYVGFADLEKYRDDLTFFGGELVKGYRYGISIGIVLPDSIVDFLPKRSDNNVACAYQTHAYSIVNDRLNYIASKLSSFLNREGYRTLPIGVADRTNEEEAIPTVSHKMIARIAGLGWIGKNCLLITPEYGPRVRFISLLTEAPLRAVDNPLPQRCGDCVECVKICPVNAIKGENFRDGEVREKRFDFLKCQNYFYDMKEKFTWHVCGMCLYICPYGRKKGDK